MTPTDETAAPSAAEPTPPPQTLALPEERIRKVYARDVHEKDHLHTVFRASRKQKTTSRNGKTFLAVTLVDRSGELDARVFDQPDALDAAFTAGDYLLVQGHVIEFHGKPQLVIEKLERLDPEPIDPREFTPPEKEPAAPSASVDETATSAGGGGAVRAVAQIREGVERVQDPHVKQLLLAFLDDPEIARGLPVAPAAKGIHHAYRGGLADHLLSVMRLASRLADQYPMADRDLLTAGALLHDLGKVTELSAEKGFGYSDEGRLVGHLVMTAQKIHEKAAKIEGFPPALEHHLTHLVISSHGALEHGSPKLPMTLEALIVHMMDVMDARVHSWLELMAKDPNDRWTERSALYDRHLFKGKVPTSRNKSAVEGARSPGRKDREPGRRRREREARGARAEGTSGPRADAARSADSTVGVTPSRDFSRKSEKAPTRDPGLPKELAFKPFSALIGTPPTTEGNGGEPA